MADPTDIKTLLDRLYLIPSAEGDRILSQWESLDESAKHELRHVLEGALAAQDALIHKICELDPTFPDRLSTFMHQQVQAQKGSEQKRDENLLGDIEKQLDQ